MTFKNSINLIGKKSGEVCLILGDIGGSKSNKKGSSMRSLWESIEDRQHFQESIIN